MLIKLKQEFLGSAAGKVMEVKEADGKALIERGIADAAGDDVLSPVLTKAMETLTERLSSNVQSMTEAVLKRFAEAQDQARKHAVPAIFGDGGQGDSKKNFGDWLRHAIIACTGKGKDAASATDYLENENNGDAAQFPEDRDAI